MLKKIRILLAAAVILAAAILGIYEKQTYTNYTGEANYMSYFQVAQFPGELVDSTIPSMRSNLKNSPYILKVTADKNEEYRFQSRRQGVHVDEVYHGNGIHKGDEIYIIFNSWALVTYNMTCNMGFTNYMNKGETYLVFLSSQVDTTVSNDDRPVYALADSLISPVFSYSEHTNTVASMNNEDDTTYVDYEDVKNNEFFMGSDNAMQAILKLKDQMISTYQ